MIDDQKENISQYTVQDFETLEWQKAFKGQKNSACISSYLWKLAQKAEEEKKNAQAALLGLLGNVSSMALHPMSPNMPFSPSLTLRKSRSAGPDDFSEAELDFLQVILPSISEPWLRARLADLLWLRRRREAGITVGIMAIDAYMETPLTKEAFSGEGGLYWMRALRLTRMLKKAVGNREKIIESNLLSACYTSEIDDRFLGRWIADILRGFELGRGQEEVIANKMSGLAAKFIAQFDYHGGRDYYEAAHFWFFRIKKEETAFNAIALLAESWCAEAVAYEKIDNFIGATHCLEKAIQSYRRIPHKYRDTLGVKQKPLELQAQLNKLSSRVEENLIHLQIPIENIHENLQQMTERAQQSVQGKKLPEALYGFLGLYRGVNLDSSRTKAEKELKTFHFGMFGSTTTMSSSDGRVIKKRPSTISIMDDTEAHEQAVQDEILRHHLLEIGLVANGYIVPALETMVIEHRLTEDFFVTLCQQATIVPPERAKAWGRMLFAGYEFDFDDVIHRLVPQMEKMVRYHLRAAGVVTTVVDEQGIENEVNLSTLLEKPESISIFGKERIFEMSALFCEPSGPKFRHGLAHGLLEDKDFESALALYTWWFALKLVLTPFQNSLSKE